MSRTYKDKPWKVRHPEEDDYSRVEYELETPRVNYWGALVTHSHYGIKLPGVKTKKKRQEDTEWHWMSTPSWWTRMFMNRPRRHFERQMEKQILKTVDLEDFDFIDWKKKPHIYYW